MNHCGKLVRREGTTARARASKRKSIVSVSNFVVRISGEWNAEMRFQNVFLYFKWIWIPTITINAVFQFRVWEMLFWCAVNNIYGFTFWIHAERECMCVCAHCLSMSMTMIHLLILWMKDFLYYFLFLHFLYFLFLL